VISASFRVRRSESLHERITLGETLSVQDTLISRPAIFPVLLIIFFCTSFSWQSFYCDSRDVLVIWIWSASFTFYVVFPLFWTSISSMPPFCVSVLVRRLFYKLQLILCAFPTSLRLVFMLGPHKLCGFHPCMNPLRLGIILFGCLIIRVLPLGRSFYIFSLFFSG